jgi:hypothetical protein
MGNFRKKKRNPVRVALKVPPKEEDLEECADAWEASTRSQYAPTLGKMQAFTAAMQYHHCL